ncbi:beta-lactamase family protein [Pontibacter ummariensis]|uniref:Beta-lactamase superfamily domain-containing protein n=1 Tax=Pontibacter ummariensis TaxID=1610492 RepID=A0A239F615_9BACT|nr:MBL fold metallo-hydrolase [Pontibacter ummariensis]PRY12427.1 beta-lactamase family protein [Pontibacter ummariensis]SNS51928.1 Beta-lactamase superfamily domain-containing protein [Pontibacter ummariensis]
MKKPFRITLYLIAFLVLLTAVAGCSLMKLSPQFGAEAEGARLERIQQSPNYANGEFRNLVETNMDLGFKGYIKLLSSRIFGDNENQTPDRKIPVRKIEADRLQRVPDSATVVTWLGHSAFLIEIDGKRLLLDPMLGNRASPLSFMGPRRFSELPVTAGEMPQVDAVLISHDHYDHLDLGSIQELAEKTEHFYVPLGLGMCH